LNNSRLYPSLNPKFTMTKSFPPTKKSETHITSEK
jgi:hypothetical protein